MKVKRGTFFWHSPLRTALHNVGYKVYLSKAWWFDGKRRCFLTEPTEEFPQIDFGNLIVGFSPEPWDGRCLGSAYQQSLNDKPRYRSGRQGGYTVDRYGNRSDGLSGYFA